MIYQHFKCGLKSIIRLVVLRVIFSPIW